MKNSKSNLILILTIALCIVTILVCTTIGTADIKLLDTFKILLAKLFKLNIDLSQIKKSAIAIIWSVRFPRIILSLFVGGALAICGVAYQGLFKNPMAEPYILGVSSGAAVGASIGIVFNISFYFLGINAISILAFIGALIALFTVYNIAKIGMKTPSTTLLLSGIALGQFLSAILSLLMVFSGDKLHKIIYWTMGSFNGRSWNHLFMVVPYVVIGIIILIKSSREMDIMLLGEETASQLGVNTETLKRKVLFTTALVTSAAVSVSGIIGFVGLIIPHIVRMIVGPKHNKLYPYSFFIGGIFMIFCDTIARTAINEEIPVGIITAIFGGPFFIFLLKKKKREGI